MKSYLLPLLILILSISSLTAQISNYYTFSSTTGNYNAITGTAITTILGDNVLSSALDIGFSFPYGLNTYTQIKMSSNGFMYLGTIGTSTSQNNSLVSTTVCPVVAPLWDNLNLTGGGAAYITEGTEPNRVFTCQWSTCKWNNNSASTFDFQAKLYENGKIEFVYGNATGTPTSPSASIGINMSTGGSDNYLSVTPGSPATSSSTTEMSTIAAFPGSNVIYNFNPVIQVPSNMACLSISGNITPTMGIPSRYRITVRNAGTAAQSDYLVKIMSGDTELASVPGIAIQPLTSATVTVSWTPSATGDITIYGKVILVGDTITVNDQSSSINLTVQEAGIHLITIGSGNQTSMIPMDMYYRNSLFETVFQSTEIDTFGMITEVSFYNNFVSNLAAMPTKIWLGTTAQSDLSTGWIASTLLTQVYDGTVNYPTGQNIVHVSFTTPYTYTGGNLVMMVNRPIEALSYNSSDLFQCQTVGTNRSRNIYSSTVTYDPTSPPTTGSTLSGQFPKTSFTYYPVNPNPVFGINPSAKDWGSVLMNSINTQSFVIFNSGSTALTINSIAVTGSEMYSLSGLPVFPLVIEAGQTSTFSCIYQPTAAGLSNAVITIADNLNWKRAIHLIPLQGSCYDPTIYSLPYSQNFDGVTTPGLPLDWLKYVPTTSNGSVTTVTSVIVAPNSSPNSADLYNNTDNAGTILLVAPPLVDTINLNTTQITFWARGYQNNYTLSVGRISTPFDPATYTELQSITLAAAWTEYTVHLADSTESGHYVAFMHGLGGTYRGLYVDDVIIETIPIPIEEGQLQGHVYGIDNQPLPNATVQVVDGGQAITDELGNYMISNIPIGEHQVTASYFGFHDQTITVIIIQDSTLTQDFNLNEVPYTPAGLSASESLDHTSVNLTWLAPILPDSNKQATSRLQINKTGTLTRSLIGYQVWRLNSGQESNEGTWVLLTQDAINTLNFTDTAWSTQPSGTYEWAVKAIYTGNIPSQPTFSNILETPLVVFGTLTGFVSDGTSNTPINGARISSGSYSTFSNADGNYSLLLPQGEQTVQCMVQGYPTDTQNVTIIAGQQLVLNFLLILTSTSDPGVVTATKLLGNYPNPFTGTTLLSFSVKDAAPVKVEIYNMKGQLVRTLVNDTKSKGTYKVLWNGKDQNGNQVSSGIYYCKMYAGKYSSTRKMLLMK